MNTFTGYFLLTLSGATSAVQNTYTHFGSHPMFADEGGTSCKEHVGMSVFQQLLRGLHEQLCTVHLSMFSQCGWLVICKLR